MHADAEDQHRDLWPDAEDAVSILTYTRLRHRALRGPTSSRPQRADQAAARLILIRVLRNVLDREELAAIEDARAAETEWAVLAGHLGLENPGSAALRHRRLLGALEDPQGRRTWAAGSAVIERRLRQRDEQGRAAAAVARHHRRVMHASEDLLAHAEDLAVSDECAADWLPELQECLAIGHPSAGDKKRLASLLGVTINEIISHAADESIPAARTSQAQAALDRAMTVRNTLHLEYGQEA
ncbi:hypothetical protein AB0C84_41970 [Actinomadura sp. NPDC048955]|uniref:hypothetical protein n=1 Tax=Actinomadura sp. NPDC048955 TaxID=3158228 RepID=UPI0033F52D2B